MRTLARARAGVYAFMCVRECFRTYVRRLCMYECMRVHAFRKLFLLLSSGEMTET
jgi:hypothetical protein